MHGLWSATTDTKNLTRHFFTPTFAKIQRMHNAKMKTLKSTGLSVKVTKAEPISIKEEEQ